MKTFSFTDSHPDLCPPVDISERAYRVLHELPFQLAVSTEISGLPPGARPSEDPLICVPEGILLAAFAEIDRGGAS